MLNVPPTQPLLWILRPGALWVLPSGETHYVIGLHREWLEANPDLSNGFRDPMEVICELGWLSVVCWANRHIEICLSSLDDQSSCDVLTELLRKNEGKWCHALILLMAEEGGCREFSSHEFFDIEDKHSLLLKEPSGSVT